MSTAQDRRVATLLALLDRLAPSVRAQIKARIEALDDIDRAVGFPVITEHRCDDPHCRGDKGSD